MSGTGIVRNRKQSARDAKLVREYYAIPAQKLLKCADHEMTGVALALVKAADALRTIADELPKQQAKRLKVAAGSIQALAPRCTMAGFHVFHASGRLESAPLRAHMRRVLAVGE